MHRRFLFSVTVSLIATFGISEENNLSLIEKLISANKNIHTLHCDVRREVEVGRRRITTLSRVWFEREDHLHVETTTPVQRRIIVDGKAIHKWIEGYAKGVRIPLVEAPESELIEVRRVPGTSEKYLLRLQDIAEIPLPPKKNFPVRRGYRPPAPHPYTVLALDNSGRLASIEFFDPASTDKLLARTVFSAWREVAQKTWIACTQKSVIHNRDGTMTHETLRISGLTVNKAIESSRFDVAVWSGPVKFVREEEMAEELLKEKLPKSSHSKK